MAVQVRNTWQSGGGSAHQRTQMLSLEKPAPTIPLVGHIISDDDLGVLQGAKLQPINLNKVVKLLTDPHSAMLYDRHIHALKKVIKYYQQGFVMKDLVAVFKVINVCADRSDEQPLYIDPMLAILKICSLPFLKEKTSDEITYEQIAVESISQLGYLMRIPVTDVRMQICETLIQFYCEKPSMVQKVQKHKANSASYNQKIVEQSDVSETLVKSLALMEDDIQVRIKVLQCLQILSKKSQSNCLQMLKAQAAARLAHRLLDPDSSGQLLFRSSDILWNLLENGSREEVAQQLNSLSAVTQLQTAFTNELTQGYSHYHRQLRNDLLVLSTLVASVCPDAPFVETGFVKQLTLYATFQEVKSHNAIIKHLKLLQNHEDFELKKLLITILVVLSKDRSVIPILSDGKLLLALFSYVKANEKSVGSIGQDWTTAQTEELQLHAMSALATLGPAMVEDYMMCQGNTRLLLLLEWCVGSDNFGGTGNGFYGVGGRNNKKAQMRMCLRLMRSMVSTGLESVLQDMTDQGAINQITTILSNILKKKDNQQQTKKSEAAAAVDIEMQCDMLFILSTLCENDLHRKELFGSEGVDVCVEYLRAGGGEDVGLLSSGLGHHRLLLAAVDCVWCAVVGCYVTEDYFLEREGVFLLIDLLEKCPKSMHNLVLGCLLDLAENPKTIPHIMAWQGAPHLLCELWRDEEKQLGVSRQAENGAISDPKRPLMGQLQFEQGIIPLPATCPSQAIVDVSENMRAKIYALFGKIGFIELPGVTTEDHVTLTVIEHYLDLKLGEVWGEVLSELDQEEIRPITPDREALEAINRTIEDRSEHISMVQKELLDAQRQQDLMDEQEHYAEIRENHRQKEKTIADFQDYVARTSNYVLLQAAKQRQELSVDASRVTNTYAKADTSFHPTEVPKLNTTTFSGRNVTITMGKASMLGGQQTVGGGDTTLMLGSTSTSSGNSPVMER